MSLILDTHVFFWWITDDPRLPSRYRDALSARGSPVFVSAVSGWDIGIKVKLGKWPEAEVLLPDLTSKVQQEQFDVLNLTLAQAERAGGLDLAHRDPFDRMIAAQALDLDYAIATTDPAFEFFGCRLV